MPKGVQIDRSIDIVLLLFFLSFFHFLSPLDFRFNLSNKQKIESVKRHPGASDSHLNKIFVIFFINFFLMNF